MGALHVGRKQATQLAKNVARRRKNKTARALAQIETTPSLRSQHKARRHKAYLDQVELDKERGLESGKVCRAFYKDQRAKARAKPARK